MGRMARIVSALALLMVVFVGCDTVVSRLLPGLTATATSGSSNSPDYRAWIEQARVQYPYAESADKMWQVMQCESSGNPNIGDPAGQHFGLFQYNTTTWAGDWNPYRDHSIFDAQAQIFATAKAWHDGNQAWWGCYLLAIYHVIEHKRHILACGGVVGVQ